MSVIPTFKRWRQEVQEFKVNHNCTVSGDGLSKVFVGSGIFRTWYLIRHKGKRSLKKILFVGRRLGRWLVLNTQVWEPEFRSQVPIRKQ